MTYFSSNEVSRVGGDAAFLELSKPLGAGNDEGIETCRMLVWNCDVIKEGQKPVQQKTKHKLKRD